MPVRMVIFKKTRDNKSWRGCGKKGNLMHCCGNVNWCRHYGEQYEESSKNKKYDPYDPAVPLLGIYLKEMKTLTQEDICTPTLTVALVTNSQYMKTT